MGTSSNIQWFDEMTDKGFMLDWTLIFREISYRKLFTTW